METRIAFGERLHLDVPLLLGVLVLSAFGLVALYSAGGQDTDLVVRQAIRFGVGFGLMFVVAQIAPRRFFDWAPLLYLAGVLLLCAVLVVGETAQGAQRWLRVGPFSFQPSEFVKLTVPLMVAWFISKGDLPPRLWRVVLLLRVAERPDFIGLHAGRPDAAHVLIVVGGAGAAGVHQELRDRVDAAPGHPLDRPERHALDQQVDDLGALGGRKLPHRDNDTAC